MSTHACNGHRYVRTAVELATWFVAGSTCASMPGCESSSHSCDSASITQSWIRQAPLAGRAACVVPKRRSCSAPGTVAAAMILQRCDGVNVTQRVSSALVPIADSCPAQSSLHFVQDTTVCEAVHVLRMQACMAILRGYRCGSGC